MKNLEDGIYLKAVPRTDSSGRVTIDLVDCYSGKKLMGVVTEKFIEGVDCVTGVELKLFLYQNDGSPYDFSHVE